MYVVALLLLEATPEKLLSLLSLLPRRKICSRKEAVSSMYTGDDGSASKVIEVNVPSSNDADLRATARYDAPSQTMRICG